MRVCFSLYVCVCVLFFVLFPKNQFRKIIFHLRNNHVSGTGKNWPLTGFARYQPLIATNERSNGITPSTGAAPRPPGKLTTFNLRAGPRRDWQSPPKNYIQYETGPLEYDKCYLLFQLIWNEGFLFSVKCRSFFSLVLSVRVTLYIGGDLKVNRNHSNFTMISLLFQRKVKI